MRGSKTLRRVTAPALQHDASLNPNASFTFWRPFRFWSR